MSLKTQLYKSIKSMPGGIAGGYIDLAQNRLVDMLSMEPHAEGVLERLVGISNDLFQGPNVLLIEDIFRKVRGSSDSGRHFQEIVVSNESLMHIFLRVPNQQEQIVTFVCKSEVSPVLCLVKARAETLKLSAAYRAEKSR